MDPPRVSSIRTGGGGGSLIGLVRRKFSNFPPKIDRKRTENNKRKKQGGTQTGDQIQSYKERKHRSRHHKEGTRKDKRKSTCWMGHKMEEKIDRQKRESSDRRTGRGKRLEGGKN